MQAHCSQFRSYHAESVDPDPLKPSDKYEGEDLFSEITKKQLKPNKLKKLKEGYHILLHDICFHL